MTDETTAGGAVSPPATHQHIAVSMSGGGHRAALFGLGALLYLVDAGKGPEIASIASVSGGSLTNGYVGLRVDLTETGSTDRRERFWQDVKPAAVASSTGGTVWAWWPTYAYLILLAALLGLATWACFPLGAWPSIGVWLVTLLIVGWLARQRSRVAAGAFDAKLFDRARLDEMNAGVDHVLTAADLQTAEQVYLSGRFLYSYRLGWGNPAAIRVSWAAQASACLPGAFAPVGRSVASHGFANARPEAPGRFLLVDGGVYDNMATEWPINVDGRIDLAGAPVPPPAVPDELIVVNASAAIEVSNRRSARWPIIGEFTSLIADKDILYDQTTAVRRRMLYARFRATRDGRPESPPISGVIAQIDRTPTALASSFARGDDDAAERARRVLAALPDENWELEAQRNSAVKTTLSKIDADRAARLLRHAYALVMADAVVLLDYPLIPVPDLTVFRSLVERT
jgi:predicted acylesterase/phospholipase RssA